jgi:hypothetical protein
MFNFKKLFGKKNDGFFLQLEDEDATSKPEAKAKDPAPAQPAVAAPAAVVVSTDVAPVASTSTAAPATGALATVDKKATKAEEKAAEKAAKAAKRAAGKTETPTVVATAPVATPAAPAITNFATDYLIKPSSISGRRMPGANMKGFLDLARQVEKPKAFKATASERKAEK